MASSTSRLLSDFGHYPLDVFPFSDENAAPQATSTNAQHEQTLKTVRMERHKDRLERLLTSRYHVPAEMAIAALDVSLKSSFEGMYQTEVERIISQFNVATKSHVRVRVDVHHPCGMALEKNSAAPTHVMLPPQWVESCESRGVLVQSLPPQPSPSPLAEGVPTPPPPSHAEEDEDASLVLVSPIPSSHHHSSRPLPPQKNGPMSHHPHVGTAAAETDGESPVLAMLPSSAAPHSIAASKVAQQELLNATELSPMYSPDGFAAEDGSTPNGNKVGAVSSSSMHPSHHDNIFSTPPAFETLVTPQQGPKPVFAEDGSPLLF